MFGTGTAAIVSPVGNILYKDKMQSIPNSDDESAVSVRLVRHTLSYAVQYSVVLLLFLKRYPLIINKIYLYLEYGLL